MAATSICMSTSPRQMFTNLASLLLGVAASQQPGRAEEEGSAAQGGSSGAEGPLRDSLRDSLREPELRLEVLEAEDDWLLVDTEDSQRGALLASMAVAPLTPISARSRSHSLSSLPAGFEDSWYVTPPPCFTSTGPVVLETSPLENLLIEHPSMSVYAPRVAAPAPLPPQPPVQQRSASLSPSPRARQPLAAVNPPPRPGGGGVALARLQQQRQVTALHAAQKVQQKLVTQGSRRSALERTNKAREVGSARNKRPRRADHQQRHSGANNNRKCC